MASWTQWTWVWVDSGNWWWTGKPGVLQSMGLQRVSQTRLSDWTELNWMTFELPRVIISFQLFESKAVWYSLIVWEDKIAKKGKMLFKITVAFQVRHRRVFVRLFICYVCVLSSVRLSVTPWSVARQAPLSIGFSRQEYWSGLPFPSPGDLPDPGIKPPSPALTGGFFGKLSPANKPCFSTDGLIWACLGLRARGWRGLTFRSREFTFTS